MPLARSADDVWQILYHLATAGAVSLPAALDMSWGDVWRLWEIHREYGDRSG